MTGIGRCGGVKLSRGAQRRVFGWLLLLPAVIVIFSIIIYPLTIVIQGSLHEGRILKFSYDSPLTLANYERFFTGGRFVKPFLVTFLYVGITTSISFLIGFGSALLLSQRFKGRRIARVLSLLPWPVPASIAAVLWMMMVDPTVGVLNHFLTKAGVFAKPIPWLSLPIPAFIAVSITTIWKGYPFFTIILLAGLQAIPVYLYDAAGIDGAGWWQKLRHITIPGLRSVIAMGALLQALWTLRDFSIIYVMTRGGPAQATETLALHLYNQAFSYYHMNYAAAVGIVILLISLAMAVIAIRHSATEFGR